MVWGAILGGVASAVVGGFFDSKAASKQKKFAKKQAAYNEEMRKQAVSAVAPYAQFGSQALGPLWDIFTEGNRFGPGNVGYDAIAKQAAPMGKLHSGQRLTALVDYYNQFQTERFRQAGVLATMGQQAAFKIGDLLTGSVPAQSEAYANMGNAASYPYGRMGDRMTGIIDDYLFMREYNKRRADDTTSTRFVMSGSGGGYGPNYSPGWSGALGPTGQPNPIWFPGD